MKITIDLKKILDIKHVFKKKEKIVHETKGLQVAKEIALIAMSLQLTLEILSYRSIINGLLTPLYNPLMFLCGALLLSCFLSLGLLLPKRHLGYLIISVGWLWLGITNFILLSYRTTPLTATDFKMLSSVITIVDRYLNTFQMILVGMAVLIITISISVFSRKLPYTKFHFRQLFLTTSISCLLTISCFNAAHMANAVSTNYGNIAMAFKDYGFAYSFTTSVIDKGISRPRDYSPEKIFAVREALAMDEPKEIPEIRSTLADLEKQLEPYLTNNALNINTPIENETISQPNIIFIQLESFFDVKRLKSFEYNMDPTPNLTYLQEHFTSGFVTVPSIGAGTANTEFEILTGMSLDYFGPGEYPYKTILREKTVESMPYTLAEKGYHSHAIHNNMGTFYARYYVYPRLGFNSFSSIEYMNNLTYTPLDWAKDEILTPEITKALTWTKEEDFIFAVSVQPHGQYPVDEIIESPIIIPTVLSDIPEMINKDQETFETSEDEAPMEEVSLLTEEVLVEDDLATYNKYLYFVNQIYETDQFIGELIDALEVLDQPTVLVLYGDHFPSLDITEDDLTSGSSFQTEYVVWDNLGLEEDDKDLMAYQLGASILESTGHINGIINRFHQTMSQEEDYEEELQLLQYDMLYGDQNIYGGSNPHKKTKMTMGVKPIEITNVLQKGETIVVYGRNFTKWSEVYVNKERVETLFYNDSMLIVPYIELKNDMEIVVSQMTVTNRKLSSTKKYTLK